jgi:hypothetical protein
VVLVVVVGELVAVVQAQLMKEMMVEMVVPLPAGPLVVVEAQVVLVEMGIVVRQPVVRVAQVQHHLLQVLP